MTDSLRPASASTAKVSWPAAWPGSPFRGSAAPTDHGSGPESWAPAPRPRPGGSPSPEPGDPGRGRCLGWLGPRRHPRPEARRPTGPPGGRGRSQPACWVTASGSSQRWSDSVSCADAEALAERRPRARLCGGHRHPGPLGALVQVAVWTVGDPPAGAVDGAIRRREHPGRRLGQADVDLAAPARPVALRVARRRCTRWPWWRPWGWTGSVAGTTAARRTPTL